MPTYEYACRECGEHVEVVQSFRDDPLTTCGLCGGSLRKVFSAAGIVFKGSGYYVTDSRKKPASDSAPASGSASSSTSDTSSPGSGSSGSDSSTTSTSASTTEKKTA